MPYLQLCARIAQDLAGYAMEIYVNGKCFFFKAESPCAFLVLTHSVRAK